MCVPCVRPRVSARSRTRRASPRAPASCASACLLAVARSRPGPACTALREACSGCVGQPCGMCVAARVHQPGVDSHGCVPSKLGPVRGPRWPPPPPARVGTRPRAQLRPRPRAPCSPGSPDWTAASRRPSFMTRPFISGLAEASPHLISCLPRQGRERHAAWAWGSLARPGAFLVASFEVPREAASGPRVPVRGGCRAGVHLRGWDGAGTAGGWPPGPGHAAHSAPLLQVSWPPAPVRL